jgi:uncharacterized phiE125 gp8 family phage protein
MSIQSPVTLDEAKDHLRVVGTDDNNYINGLLLAATDWAEKFQNRTFVQRARTMELDEFKTIICPPYPPLVSVTSIVYVDTNGTNQTLSATYYRVNTGSEPGRITEAYGYYWPLIRDVTGAVTIIYEAGYGKAAKVPDDVKAAIKLIVGHLYEHREAVSEVTLNEVPMTAKSLLWPNRIMSFGSES